MSGTLSHSRSDLVTRDMLKLIPPPAATDTWKPIPHYDLIHAIDRQLRVRDLEITKEEFALYRGGLRLFGVLELAVAGLDAFEDFRFAMGIRTANDKSEALTIVAGARVFVCDNLSLSGDLIALQRKHTANVDLNADISRALDRYREHIARFSYQLTSLQERTLPDDQAKLLIFEAFARDLLPIRLFPAVVETYFHPRPEMTDVAPRTHWGLHNAFTRCVKQLAPGPAFAASTGIGRLFGLTSADA